MVFTEDLELAGLHFLVDSDRFALFGGGVTKVRKSPRENSPRRDGILSPQAIANERVITSHRVASE